MTNPRFLPKRMQSVLATILIGALLTTSLPLATAANTSSPPAANIVMASEGTAAPSSGVNSKGAMASPLAPVKNSTAAPSAALQDKLPKGTVCSALTPRNGPQWNDRQRWNAPEYYETIKLADIDGDGSAELLGRAADDIKVYGWDTQNRRWIARKDGPALGNEPYINPEYYETLQFANIDDQPGAELLVRSPEGMRAFHYNKSMDTWTELTAGNTELPLSDAKGFNKPEFYQTIQTADLDKDGRAELIARAGDGINVWKWNVNDKKWVPTGAVLPLTGFDQPKYYRTIQTGDVDGDGNPELLLRDATGVHTYKWTNGVWSEPYGVLGLADPAWGAPQNYLTIQTANLDNVGGVELLARSEDGLLVYRLNGKAWEGPICTLALSDANGWNSPQYYQTIQAADLDGDKKDEIIARGTEGLHVYKAIQAYPLVWNEPSKIFTLMNDSAGWDQESSYLTIQTGNVDAIGGAEIIGRSRKELETIHYDKEKGLYQQKMNLMFPAFSGNQLAIYQYISSKLLAETNANRNDVRKEYDDVLLSVQFNDHLHDVTRVSKPPQFTQADWDAVFHQLDLETEYVINVKDWFGYVKEQNTQFGLANSNALNSIVTDLDLETEEAATGEILFLVFKSLLAIAGAVLGPIESTVSKAIEAVIEITETAIETAQEAVKIANGASGEDFKATGAKLKKELADNYNNSVIAVGCLQDAYLNDWDLMQSLGVPIQAGTIKWNGTIAAQAFVAAQNNFQLSTWQALTAARWEIDNYRH